MYLLYIIGNTAEKSLSFIGWPAKLRFLGFTWHTRSALIETTEMGTIVGILLTAGSGKRFGSDKLMQELPGGVPIAVQACRHLLAGTDKVLAVVRPGSETLADRLRTEGAIVNVCTDAGQGIGTSLAFGVANSPAASGWLIALGDMPWIAPASICIVADALRSGALIVAPSWRGRRGHPVGFSHILRNELIALSGDVGAKSVIQSHQDQVRIVECNDPGVLKDIDHPDDLKQLNDNLCL